jgi:hypothetical protein
VRAGSADEWLEWLGDEERHAGDDPVAKMQVLSLYDQAVQDYRCTVSHQRPGCLYNVPYPV